MVPRSPNRTNGLATGNQKGDALSDDIRVVEPLTRLRSMSADGEAAQAQKSQN
jgi:hypothetical protein